MYGEPAAWHALLDRLADLVGRYLAAQAGAGARALQLFDSWVGCLSPADYREYVLPHSRRALELAGAAGVPVIHFGTDTAKSSDRKSTRLNSSHSQISYAVFCLKKKNIHRQSRTALSCT